MSRGDAVDLAVLLLVAAGVAGALSLWLAARRPRRGGWRVVLVSALPVPALALIPCLLLFASVVTRSPAQCGVDACGMAAAMAVLLMVYGVLPALAVGLLAPALVQWFVRR